MRPGRRLHCQPPAPELPELTLAAAADPANGPKRRRPGAAAAPRPAAPSRPLPARPPPRGSPRLVAEVDGEVAGLEAQLDQLTETGSGALLRLKALTCRLRRAYVELERHGACADRSACSITGSRPASRRNSGSR